MGTNPTGCTEWERDYDPMTEKPENTVSDQLAKLAYIFKERNATYGDTFRHVGEVLENIFPNGLAIQSPDDWNRLCAFLHIVDKVMRYGNNFDKGGHADSLNDVSVYAQILQMLDRETKT